MYDINTNPFSQSIVIFQEISSKLRAFIGI